MQEISGYIERITFHNEENGYTVAQLQQPKKQQLTCIVGSMPGIQVGESLRCLGEWKNHLVHGLQFEVSSFYAEIPADVMGIQKYLGSGLIKGIGKKYAERIVQCFGASTLSIIDTESERLSEVPGLGKKRIEQIKSSWQEQRSIRDVMVFLQTYNVSPSFAQKIYKTYGNQSISKVQENPYALARDIFGIGFKTADSLAKKMGMALDAPQRLDAGIEYTLSELSSEGHVCYPVDEFLKEIEKTFETKSEQILSRFPSLKEEHRIELHDLIEKGEKRSFIWLRPLFLAEQGLVREIKRLTAYPSSLRPIDTGRALLWVQEKLKIELAMNQQTAVIAALTKKLHIITGGPGTGKSTITNAILSITQQLTDKIVMAAPTGRAAKRMSEITGHKATTIHSLLSFDFKKKGFKHNRDNPIDCDLIIIDEASMIDTLLMYSLFKAIPEHARVILVGDIHQLPSIGPGNVLRDMIHSLSISVTTLTDIFRQAAGSHIITNAHRVNQGNFPQIYNGENSDFFFIEAEEAQDALNTIIKVVSQRIPHRYGLSPFKDIQVLAPMKKGLIGTENLNQVLQTLLNPKESAIFRGGRRFQLGDKVMQIRNNYQKEVFNGDIGLILMIDPEEESVVVKFEEREVIYDFTDLDELVLAYAISIHKFQGSECPCVVLPIHTSHFMLLNRNLLYTGITRGKKLVILVGTKRALAMAVKNNHVQKRYTSLQQSLMENL